MKQMPFPHFSMFRISEHKEFLNSNGVGVSCVVGLFPL